MTNVKNVDTHDIIRSKQLGEGFMIFQNDDGFFVGMVDNGELLAVCEIDRSAYNSIEKSGGGRKKP